MGDQKLMIELEWLLFEYYNTAGNAELASIRIRYNFS